MNGSRSCRDSDANAVNPDARTAYPVLILLVLLVLAPMAGLLSLGNLPGFSASELDFWQSPYIRRVLWFSLWQASLSTLFSVVPAILVARALASQANFPLRGLLLRLFGLPLVVPSIVAVLGVVSVYGSQGWLPLGRSLYGLNGILLAHVFFNLPLAVRLLLPLWYSIPAQHWRLAEQLGFDGLARWRWLEWPALREGLPGVILLIFMLCLTSFAVVLTLGGGPRSTTLEVAIYQSLRFDFDPVRAVVLALLQLTLCALVATMALRFQRMPEVEISLAPGQDKSAKMRWPALLLILFAALFVGAPLLALLLDAIRGPVADVLANPALWQAALHTLMIGLCATLLALVLGWMLLQTSSDLANRGRTRPARLIEACASLVYVIPPLVIGTGYFVLLARRVDVFDWVFVIVIVVNTLMGLPFVVRTLGPAMRQHRMRYRFLCQSLALRGWNRFRWIDWPLLRKPVGLSAALVIALTMGDLGVIALFGTPQTATLPLLIYQQLGAYLIPEATVTAVFLLLLCLLVFGLCERLLGGRGSA